MSKPDVVILGAGPAGLGAAYQLQRRDRGRAIVLERAALVGGNAGSFEWEGQRLDYGSHRLHPACEPEILADIRRLLGDDLLDRPRHGRIRLLGKWIHFPLKPLDLLLRLERGFTLGTLRDMLRKPAANGSADTFASVLHANLGPTICKHFYFPYARKLWGREPDELSGIQARRRVSAGSFLKLVRKVLNAVPGLKKPGSGRFFYPRRNFGQIVEAYGDAAVAAGADLRLGAEVVKLVAPKEEGGKWSVHYREGEAAHELQADQLWSTIPLPTLARLVDPPAEAEVQEAIESLHYRSMLLIYLRLEIEQFTEYDAHYFPEEATVITRLSEPKNYVGEGRPGGFTTLCAELPCTVGDLLWNMSEAQLGEVVSEDLARAGIPLPVAPAKVRVERLSHAYPIYLNGYEKLFEVLDRWADRQPQLLTFGRQGLFAHDNTHHALAMAYAAVECLEEGALDAARWESWREVFATFVVED